jgi:hypothetical protein
MDRKQVSLLAALALLAALVIVLAVRNRQPPPLPEDGEHRGGAAVDRCLACHGPEGVLPRSRNHPVGLDCLRCHGAP